MSDALSTALSFFQSLIGLVESSQFMMFMVAIGIVTAIFSLVISLMLLPLHK